MKHLLIATLLLIFITACGSEDDPSAETQQPEVQEPEIQEPEVQEPETFAPESKNFQTISLIDINGNPVSNTSVSISKFEVVENKALSRSISSRESLTPSPITASTDSSGRVNVDELTPGTYLITLELGGTSTTFTIVINSLNAQEIATIAAPVVITETDSGELVMTDMSNKGVFFSVSGVVYDDQGPVDHAQVSISGGQATNGAIVSTTTNEDGFFVLIINVGLSNIEALQTASVRIVKESYDSIMVTDINAVEVASISGLNIKLTQSNSTEELVYEEGFDQTLTEASCGSWISYSTNGDPAYIADGIVEEGLIDLWHEHQAGLDILNQAFDADLVVLAPDDTSEGYIPEPALGRACWYGEAEPGSITQGNFLGSATDTSEESEEYYEDELLGGTSTDANEAALESPEIDLTNETSPLSLNFKTWWEIESVNPNENGFDIMSIEYKEGSNDWITLAKLNPLSDPVTSCDVNRAPLPYTNAGFNKAPLWLWQEPISLDQLAGKLVKLRFKFATKDELFNGFRGWLVDELSIQKTPGTFPLYIDRDDQTNNAEYPEQNCDTEEEPADDGSPAEDSAV